MSLFSVTAMMVLAQTVKAEESPVCQSAKAAVRNLEVQEQVTKAIGRIRPTHQVKLLNGWVYYGESGLVFDSRPVDQRLQGPAEPIIAPWSKGDVQVVRQANAGQVKENGDVNPMMIYIENNVGESGQPEKKNGGIFKVTSTDESNGVTCPDEPLAYGHHFFPSADVNGRTTGVQAGDVYCVRTLDGERYALMQVETTCDTGLVFTYKYNGNSRYFPADLQSTGPTFEEMFLR